MQSSDRRPFEDIVNSFLGLVSSYIITVHILEEHVLILDVIHKIKKRDAQCISE